MLTTTDTSFLAIAYKAYRDAPHDLTDAQIAAIAARDAAVAADALEKRAKYIRPVDDDVFTESAWTRAYRKAKRNPGTLTDLDLSVLAHYDQQDAQQAAEKRAVALGATHAADQQQALPVVVTKSAPRADDIFHSDDDVTRMMNAFEKALVDEDPADWNAFVQERGAGLVRLFTLDAFASSWVIAINNKNRKRQAQIDQLEQRLAALEQRPSLQYEGTYEPGKAYASGTALTYDGSIWIAQQDTCRVPGTADSGWRLAVKRGRDGKDRR